LFAQFRSAFNPFVISLAERIERGILLHRQCQVTSANADRTMETLNRERSVTFPLHALHSAEERISCG
jgi:hypothetical protein